MLFSGGPCTEGPGLVVGPALKEPMRSHNDMEKEITKHVKRATKYYEGLAKRAAEKGFTCDIFAGCLDQVGLHEMRSLVNMTNGNMVLSDSFGTAIFKQSFAKMFKKDMTGNLNMGFNAMIEVQTSKELRVCGMIGPAVSANKKTSCVGETEIGISGTSAWKFCSINNKTSCAFYFEVANQQQGALAPGSRGIIQFSTFYQHANGQYRLRVTTIARAYDFFSLS